MISASAKSSLLEKRIAKLFELELFPEKSVLRSAGPMWMLVDPKDRRRFLGWLGVC